MRRGRDPRVAERGRVSVLAARGGGFAGRSALPYAGMCGLCGHIPCSRWAPMGETALILEKINVLSTRRELDVPNANPKPRNSSSELRVLTRFLNGVYS